MAAFVSIIAKERKRNLTADEFSVKFADPEMFNTPAESFGHDMLLAQAGLMAPSAMLKKYLDLSEDDATAAQTMAANKKLFSFLDPITESEKLT
jgi:hypothetical protein